MATRDKRLDAMRRSAKSVRFSELRAVLEDHGFVGRPGKGDHWVFHHPSHPVHITIDPRRPHVLAPYVRNAPKAIEAVLEREET